MAFAELSNGDAFMEVELQERPAHGRRIANAYVRSRVARLRRQLEESGLLSDEQTDALLDAVVSTLTGDVVPTQETLKGALVDKGFSTEFSSALAEALLPEKEYA